MFLDSLFGHFSPIYSLSFSVFLLFWFIFSTPPKVAARALCTRSPTQTIGMRDIRIPVFGHLRNDVFISYNKKVTAEWQNGYAEDCKSFEIGSIPVSASSLP